MLTVNVLKDADTAKVVEAARAANPARGVQEFGQQMLTALGATPRPPRPRDLRRQKRP